MLRILFSSAFIFLLLIFNSCGNERVGCNGRIIVENQIPDTTLYVGGEEYRRDISEPPKVFSHTESERIHIEVTAEDIDIVGAGTAIDENNNRQIIKVRAKKSGSTMVEVIGQDDCPDGGTPTSFNVTVVDTTN